MNTAASIRVWQGFMNEEYQAKQAEFYNLLGSVFIPVTSQAMTPLGLQAYFPGILPYTEQQLPDEIALVVYPSQDGYYAASRDTVIGRAYGKLHGDVFNFDASGSTPASWSMFPEQYTGQKPEAHTCYFISGKSLDWSKLDIHCFCFQWSANDNLTTADDLQAVLQSAQNIMGSSNTPEEIIISLGNTYCLVWLCMNGSNNPDTPTISLPNSALKFHLTAQEKSVAPMWTANDQGLAVTPNNLYNIILDSH